MNSIPRIVFALVDENFRNGFKPSHGCPTSLALKRPQQINYIENFLNLSISQPHRDDTKGSKRSSTETNAFKCNKMLAKERSK